MENIAPSAGARTVNKSNQAPFFKPVSVLLLTRLAGGGHNALAGLATKVIHKENVKE